MSVKLQALNQELATLLPDASLSAQTLSQCPQISLYLIDANYSLAALDVASAERVMNKPLYWMFCWASGHAMAATILREPWRVKDKVVLDFGAGSGVVAIAAALAGAKKVIAADTDPMAQTAIAVNAELNQVSLNIIANYQNDQQPVDLICLADVLYDRDNIPLVDALLATKTPLLLADSRIKNFSHRLLHHSDQQPGETFPALGGFDEFYQVNFYQSL